MMQHKRQKNSLLIRPVFQWAIIAMVIVFSVMVFAPTSGRHSPARARALKSQSLVRSLAQCLVLYANDHEEEAFVSHEQFPGALLGRGCVEEYMLVSPVEEDDAISYIYVPGPCDFDDKQILIYEDPTHWEDFVIVGFADAHVEMLDHETFERMLAEQLGE